MAVPCDKDGLLLHRHAEYRTSVFHLLSRKHTGLTATNFTHTASRIKDPGVASLLMKTEEALCAREEMLVGKLETSLFLSLPLSEDLSERAYFNVRFLRSN